MVKHRSLRLGLLALAAVLALHPGVPGGHLPAVAAPAPLTAADDRATTPAMDATEALAAHRSALLRKQNAAITIHRAAVKARHLQRVQELGYEPSVTDPREIARQIMLNKYGWGEDQFGCYDAIIMRESRWNPYADNPRSSAYGIPQALPGARMAAFGADWRTNPVTQIRWGLDYVDDRYGSPCSAWGFKRSHGWY